MDTLLTEKRKVRARGFLEEVFNARDIRALSQYITDDYREHTRGSMTVSFVLAAFPDARLTIEHVIGDGDYVTVLATFAGSHQRPVLRLAPTGKGVTGRVAFAFRFRGDAIAEGWAECEPWGLLEQLRPGGFDGTTADTDGSAVTAGERATVGGGAGE